LPDKIRAVFDKMRAEGRTEYTEPSPEDDADGKIAAIGLN